MAFRCWTLLMVMAVLDSARGAAINKRPVTAIQPITCSSKSGEVGVCMYAWHCLLFKGTHLTTCFDGIFVGSCCKLPSSSTTESNEVVPESPTKVPDSPTRSPTPPTLDWRPVTSTSFVTSIPDQPPPSVPDQTVTPVADQSVTLVPDQSVTDQVTTTDQPALVTLLPDQSPPESSYNFQTSTEVPPTTVQDWITTEDTTVEPEITQEPFTDSQEVNSDTTQRPVQEPSETDTVRTSVLSTTTVVPSATETLTSSNINNYGSSTTRRPATPAWIPVPETTTVRPIPAPVTVTLPAPVTVTQRPLLEAEHTTVLPNRTSDSMQNYKEVCGRPHYGPRARIVGGQNARYAEWPWMISLRQWKKSTFLHKCGAALLNGLWAVTAAHCVESVPPSDLLLRMGEYDVSNDKEPESYEERRVQIVASHPKFDPRTFEYDLALLRFYQPVKFRRNILPICIPPVGQDFVGKMATVTGWGRLYEDGPLPSVMQEVKVPVITNAECESMYKKAGFVEDIPDIFICAGRAEGGKDSCEGDSGGPMVLKDSEGRWSLAGIISWGIGCALPNQPGVYTRITKFANWIEPIIAF